MPGYKEKQPFYKTNSEILKLDPITDKDLIIFNHYISRKENFQRLSGELPKGLFRISYTSIIKDLGFSRWKAQNIMKYFESKNIIECIEKSTKKGIESLYAYTSVYYDETSENDNTNCNTKNNTNDNTNLYSISNGLEGVDNTNCNTNNSTNHNTSKKELLKRDIKNNNMSDSKESDHSPGAFKSDNNNSNKTNENTITTKSKGEKEKEKNSAKKKEKEQQIKEVVEYLNIKANRNYRPGTTKTKSLISARLKDYTVEDLKAVIDFKVGEWLENEKMNKYLRPETLFNETKFENYINELPSQATEKSSQSYLEDTDVDLSIEDIIKINLGETNNQ